MDGEKLCQTVDGWMVGQLSYTARQIYSTNYYNILLTIICVYSNRFDRRMHLMIFTYHENQDNPYSIDDSQPTPLNCIEQGSP